jgi:hypothetical protein
MYSSVSREAVHETYEILNPRKIGELMDHFKSVGARTSARATHDRVRGRKAENVRSGAQEGKEGGGFEDWHYAWTLTEMSTSIWADEVVKGK